MRFLIDTNVPLTANGASEGRPACILAAVQRLRRLQHQEILVLDDTFLILKEYQRKLSPTGRPGVGYAYFKRRNPGSRPL